MSFLSKIFFIGILSAVSLSVFADDSSFPRIQVKGINPGPMIHDGTVSFYGKDTDSFFKMLPAINSVDPTFDAANAKVNRVLVLQSKNYDLEITCTKGHVDTDYTTDHSSHKIVYDEDKLTKCAIKFVKSPIREGDATDYKPVDVVTGEPKILTVK
jgi:hypothetical protein